MLQDVIRSYENYREEDRLTTNNARRIEFLTTVRVLEEWLPEGQHILDCAAGTGVSIWWRRRSASDALRSACACLDADLSWQLVQTGTIRSGDRHCFWTDNYFSTCEEMEALYASKGLSVMDHFVHDGVAPHFSDVVDGWTQAQFEVWCEHHYRVCRERSLLGASNHAVVIGRKRA